MVMKPQNDMTSMDYYISVSQIIYGGLVQETV